MDFLTRFQGMVHSDFDVLVLADGQRVAANLLIVRSVDGECQTTELLFAAALYGQMLGSGNLLFLVALDLDADSLFADAHARLLLDDDGHAASVLGLPVADHQLIVALDVLGLMAFHVQMFVLVDLLTLIAAFLAILLPTDDLVPIAVDACLRVVPNAHVHVLLSVKEDSLAILLVFEHQLIKTASALGRIALDVAPCLVGRQTVVRHLVRVVDAADDQRAVGIAFQKVDNHFLPDAGDGQEPPFSSGGVMSDSYPARTLVVALPLAVPVKLDLHTPVLVAVDFFTIRPYDDGCLDARHQRFRSDPGGTKHDGIRNAGERVAVLLAAAVASCLVCQRFRR